MRTCLCVRPCWGPRPTHHPSPPLRPVGPAAFERFNPDSKTEEESSEFSCTPLVPSWKKAKTIRATIQWRNREAIPSLRDPKQLALPSPQQESGQRLGSCLPVDLSFLRNLPSSLGKFETPPCHMGYLVKLRSGCETAMRGALQWDQLPTKQGAASL